MFNAQPTRETERGWRKGVVDGVGNSKYENVANLKQLDKEHKVTRLNFPQYGRPDGHSPSKPCNSPRNRYSSGYRAGHLALKNQE